MRIDDVEDKVVGGSSRVQEVGRCKLQCTTDTQSPHLYRKGGLISDTINDLKTNICDASHYRLKELVIFKQHRAKETRRGPEIVKGLHDGKRSA